VTLGALVTILLALAVWLKRRRSGFAGACIKCGRTFCHRCKSARESATYCTQCIHIYLKRDGVSLDTKRKKLEEVSDHHAGMQRRNKLFATFLPGSAQVLEGRTTAGLRSARRLTSRSCSCAARRSSSPSSSGSSSRSPSTAARRQPRNPSWLSKAH
jgi:hypothetical protein